MKRFEDYVGFEIKLPITLDCDLVYTPELHYAIQTAFNDLASENEALKKRVEVLENHIKKHGTWYCDKCDWAMERRKGGYLCPNCNPK